MRGNRNYWTLLHLKYERHVFAEHGGNGSKNKSFGKDGADKVIEVPCGTVVYNADSLYRKRMRPAHSLYNKSPYLELHCLW